MADGDVRCPTCGALASPRPGASVFAHEATEPRWAGEPETAWDEPTVVGDRPPAEPWSIPIRPGAPPPRVMDAPAREPMRLVTYAAVVVAVLAGVAVLAAQVLGTGGDDVASGGDAPAVLGDEIGGEGPAAGDTGTSTTDGPEGTSDSTTTTSAPTTSSTSTTSPSTTAAPATTSAPTTTAVPSSGSVPTLSPSFRSGWVAQLSSVPTSAGSSSLEAAWERVRSDAPDAVAARSDEWPSMRDGYWVLVDAGPFASEDDVRSFCAGIGRSGDACLPRMLSDRR